MLKDHLKRTSIFIVPRASTAWRGNEAGWITASGWAAAGQQLWGEALVGTADGVFTPQESMVFPRGSNEGKPTSGKISFVRKFIPEFLITAFKDWELKTSKPKVWPIENEKLVSGKQVMMVWERHDLFPGPGRKLADKFGVPFIISVEAPVIWESRKWGVKRPVWGRWLENHFEAKSLRSADLVSCVSEEVKKRVLELGVPQEKVIVSPNRVDSTIFYPGVNGDEVALKYNLHNKRVIGWTGSFRGFHGLDSVLLAFKKVHDKFTDAVLVLVGDGQVMEKTKRMVGELKLDQAVIFPGRQPFTRIPQFVANFHVALVSAASAEGFHYSPLKLREYLATGCPVIAPRAGNLPTLFKDGVDLLFYDTGNANDLAEKMIRLLGDSILHQSLAEQSKALFEKEGTWVHELKNVVEILTINR